MSENKQVLSNWRDYAAVKKWKKGPVYGSHRQRMSPKTEQAKKISMYQAKNMFYIYNVQSF